MFYVGSFTFVLPFLAVVAEERKSRRYTLTRNYNIVYHRMTIILPNRIELLLVFLENLRLRTNVWPLFLCFQKHNTCTCQLLSLISITAFLVHILFSPAPPFFPVSFFHNTARAVKGQWITSPGFYHPSLWRQNTGSRKSLPTASVSFIFGFCYILLKLFNHYYYLQKPWVSFFYGRQYV